MVLWLQMNKGLKLLLSGFVCAPVCRPPSSKPCQSVLFMSVSSSQCFSRALVSRSLRREIIGRGSSFRPAVIMALS